MADTQRLRDLALSETGFVFDPYTGATFSVNDSGQLILNGLKEARNRDQIVNDLAQKFDVKDSDLSRDIDDFIEMLRQAGLLNPDFTF